MMDLFVYQAVQTTMILDATNYTRPMTRSVNSPSEIARNFDSIGYTKGELVCHPSTLRLYQSIHENTQPVASSTCF